MKNRIAGWALAGFLVAGSWAIFALLTGPFLLSSEPILWNLAQITCPIVALGTYLHFGVKLYWVLASNAAVYALIGWFVESLRQHFARRVSFTNS